MTCPHCDGTGTVFHVVPSFLDTGRGAVQHFEDVWDEACPVCTAQKDDRAGVEPSAA